MVPRDSNGVYTLPASNPVAPNTEISTLWANPTMSDIAQALTDSLPRNGTASMSGPLLIPDGTVGVPALAFAANATTGFRRNSSGPTIDAVVNGQIIQSVSPTAVTITKALSALGLLAPQVTLTVNTATGVASPANPMAGNPFATLEQALAYAENIVTLYPIKIVLTAGQAFAITTSSVTVTVPIALQSSGASVTVTAVTSAKALNFNSFGSSIQNINFVDVQLNISDKSFTMNTISFNFIVAQAQDNALAIDNGVVVATAIDFTRGSMSVINNSYFSTTTLVISNGKLDIQQQSSVVVTEDLTVQCQTNGLSAVSMLASAYLRVSGNTVLQGVNAFVLIMQWDCFCALAGTNVTIAGTTMSTTRCIFLSRNCYLYLVPSGTVTLTAAPTPGGVSLGDMSYFVLSGTTWTHSANMTMVCSNASLGRVASAVGNAVFTPTFGTSNAQLAQWIS